MSHPRGAHKAPRGLETQREAPRGPEPSRSHRVVTQVAARIGRSRDRVEEDATIEGDRRGGRRPSEKKPLSRHPQRRRHARARSLSPPLNHLLRRSGRERCRATAVREGWWKMVFSMTIKLKRTRALRYTLHPRARSQHTLPHTLSCMRARYYSYNMHHTTYCYTTPPLPRSL